MKKTRKALFAFIIALSVLALSACRDKEEEIVWDNDPENFETDIVAHDHYEGKTILAYIGDASHVEVPETIDGYPVTRIESEAFTSEDIVQVRVPNSLRSIALFAFQGTAIEEFTFYGDFAGKEEEVLSSEEFYGILDEHAETCFGETDPERPEDYVGMRFETGCPIVEVKEKSDEIHHGDDIYYTYDVIVDLAHYEDSLLRIFSANIFAERSFPSLRVVRLNERHRHVDYFSAIETPALEAFEVPEENPHLQAQDGVLYNKDKTAILVYPSAREAETFTIGATVESLHGRVFNGAKHLEAFAVEEGNEHFTVEDGILFNHDMTELVRYPAGRKDAAYEIPETITHIGGEAFRGAFHLERLTIPKQVELIGDPSHSPTPNRTTRTFLEMTSLEAIDVSPDNEHYFSKDGVLFYEEFLVKYPMNRPDASYTVPDGIKTISYESFRGVRLLETIHIPSGLEEIGLYAFQDAVALETVTFATEASLDRIRNLAFDNAQNLQVMILPPSVTALGPGAFRDTTSLTTLFIPASVEVAGVYLLQGSSATIHLEADSLPEGFHEDWNPDGLEVRFGETPD